MTPLDRRYRWLVIVPRDLYESLGTTNQLRTFAKTSRYVYGVATDLFPKDFCVIGTQIPETFVNKAVALDDDIVVVLFNEPEPIPATWFGMPIYDLSPNGIDAKIYVDTEATIMVFKASTRRFYVVATIINEWESEDDTL